MVLVCLIHTFLCSRRCCHAYRFVPLMDISDFLESPPNFCNGLETIYIASSRGRTFDLTTRDMGSEFRYVLGKVLSTQNCPTLRLSSHHCVLCFNLIKNMFNTYIYTHTHTHTHTSIHLSIQHDIIIPKHIPIYKAKGSQTTHVYKS